MVALATAPIFRILLAHMPSCWRYDRGMADINVTKWTPQLIPAELPPNVQPELVEPFYRKAGEVIRTSAARIHEAVCLDPECPLAFEGSTAFPDAVTHTAKTGHLTRLYYHAEYVMQINPLHPKNRGKVRMIVDPDAPDLPPHLQPLHQQGPTGREPVTNREKDRRARATAARKRLHEISEDLADQDPADEVVPQDLT